MHIWKEAQTAMISKSDASRSVCCAKALIDAE